MGMDRAGVTFASLMTLGPDLAIETARLAEQCGYRSFWTAETTGPEAFSLLAAAGAAAPSLDLGTGVLALPSGEIMVSGRVIRAGTDGRGPFPTFLRAAIAPRSLLRAASDAGLGASYVRLYEGGQQKRLREKFRVAGAAWSVLKWFVRTVSFGVISPDQTDCLLVLRRDSALAESG